MLHVRLASCLAALTLCVSAAFAQSAGDIAAGLTVVDEIAPPRVEAVETYQRLAQRNGAQTEVAYAAKVDWEDTAGSPPPSRSNRDGGSVELGGFGVVLAVLIVGGALLLWLKFGGSGVLLSRAPGDSTVRAKAPANWNITAEEMTGSSKALLDRIASMPDRSAAMVALLRYCLLAAAEATGTRFARSDTERTAFRRLPGHWPLTAGLETILQRTELAHYGGRPVDEAMFSDALRIGGSILDAKRGRAASHG